MNWRRIWLAGLLLAGSLSAGRAEPQLWPLPGRPPLRTFVAADFGGEPQVFAVAVGPSGLVYAGNLVGALEFDGARWGCLAPAGETAFFALQFDREGVLWAAGPGQIVRLGPEPGGRWQPEPILLPAGAGGRFLSSASLGEDGVVFCSATSAVRIDLAGRPSLVASGNALRLVPWEGASALIFEGQELRARIGAGCWPRLSTRAPHPLAGVQAATPLEDGLMLVSHGGGLQFFRGFEPVTPALRPSELEPGDLVQKFVVGPGGMIAASTLRSGTLLLDRNGAVLRRMTRANAGVLDDSCRGLAFDRQGGLWLASDGGLNRVQIVSDLAFVPFENMPTRLYRGAVTRGDTLWLGSSTGVMSWRSDGWLERLPGSPNSVRGMTQTVGELFIVSNGPLGGLSVVPDGTRHFETIPGPPILSGGQPAVLSPGGRWAAVAHGSGINLYRKEDGRWRWAGPEHDIPLAGTSRVALTEDWIWFECERRTLARRRFSEALGAEGPVQHLGAAQGLEPFEPPMVPGLLRWAGDCYLAAADRLWRWDRDSDRFLPVPESLGRPLQFSGGVSAVVGTDGAMYLVQSRAVQPPRHERLYRLTQTGAGGIGLTEYDLRSAGVEVFGAHPEVVDGAMRLQAFGGMLLLRIDPAAGPLLPPAAHVRRVVANGSERMLASSGTALELPYDERRELRLEFAAPWFAADLNGASPLRYRTRLRGFDADWTPSEAVAHRHFTSLPPGAYAFEVQAFGWPGDPPGPVAVLSLTIVAPWWMTQPARTLYLVGGALLCGLAAHRLTRAVFRRRLARVEAARAIESERLRIARDMHDELGSTIGRVAHLSREGRHLPADALWGRMRQIEALAAEMNEAAGGIIWAVNPAHDTLESFADRVSTYFCASLEAAGLNARLEIPATLPALVFPSSARHQLLLIVKEGVHNMVRHADAGTGWLRIGCADSVLWLEIEDDGRGFDLAAVRQRGRGYGLESQEHRVAQLGGRLRVESRRGVGTKVRIEGIRLADASR